MTEVTQTPDARSTPTHPTPAAPRSLQPLLHDLVSSVRAPALMLSAPDGRLAPGAAVAGWYVGDRRLLSRLDVALTGSALEPIVTTEPAPGEQVFTSVARGLGDPIPDPTVVVERRRRLTAEGLEEQVVVSSASQEPVDVELVLTAGTDLATMAEVKQGHRVAERPVVRTTDDALTWDDGTRDVRCALRAVAVGHAATSEPDGWRWRARLHRGEELVVDVTARAPAPAPFAAVDGAPWEVDVEAADPTLARTVTQGLADLRGLLLRDGDDAFLAAGSPWFLTLFGRDSLWAARFLAPLAPDLVLSTLRVLAARQGVREDPATEEQPGKILHEVRAEGLDLGAQRLPPVYYGSVDATALWVCAWADAADWGADPAALRALVPAARRCLAWLRAASEETGWLRYVDATGTGLSNQGWKDSHDSVQFADGRLAEAPIALSEVQAYAHEAAVRGAALLAALGEPEEPGLAPWAADLRARFVDAFWVGSPEEGHVAIALDAEGRPVDSITSNMGHVLGTGLLDDVRTARVVALLGDPALDSGFGLRTLAAGSPRFSRLSYHGGSVWPHDTAIAVRGLARVGRLDVATALTSGLLDAARAFDHRLPELFGGDDARVSPRPVPYPAACRPQAWAAAAPIAALLATVGLRVEDGTPRVVDRVDPRLGAWRLSGLRQGERRLAVGVDAEGRVSLDEAR